MASVAQDNVDYRLLNKLSNLVICSHCLRSGKMTPVPQVFSKRHKPNNICTLCRHKEAGGLGLGFGQILKFRRKG
jgi:superfamily II helicase